MTNPAMVRPDVVTGTEAPRPNTDPLPPMPAVEGSAAPLTRDEPLDSPQPTDPLMTARHGGLTTRKAD